jgi:hypothetical protein
MGLPCSCAIMTPQIDMETFMDDLQTCVVCGEVKDWRRFRIRVGDGTTKESNTCSICRSKAARLVSAKQHQKNQPCITPKMDYLLHRHPDESFSDYKRRKESGFPYYYSKIEKQMLTYCNKQTAMDRKYLRDHLHEPLNSRPYTAQRQITARNHARGWIGFYDEICNHAINLLRQTGTRPPWSQLEGKADLHKLYGVYDTKRARRLRDRG